MGTPPTLGLLKFGVRSPLKPLLCMGDLNDLMYPCGKSNVVYVNYSHMCSFHSHVRNFGLIDLGYNGQAYT